MPKAAPKKKKVAKKKTTKSTTRKKVTKKAPTDSSTQSSFLHMTIPQEVLAVFVLACMLYFAYVMVQLIG